MLTEKNSPEPRPMEVPAPFSKRKRRDNPASLNRRESYIHKKMNASDFFHFCLETFWLTLVIVAVYRNWDIFGPDVSIFVSWGRCSDEIARSTLNNRTAGHSAWKPNFVFLLLIAVSPHER